MLRGGADVQMEGGIKLGLKNRKVSTAGAVRCALHDSCDVKIVVYLNQKWFFLRNRQKWPAWELGWFRGHVGKVVVFKPTEKLVAFVLMPSMS